MIESLNRIAAIDGLSLAGKSTMVAMIAERAVNAEVVRENTFDPHRKTTAFVNKELKSNDLQIAVGTASSQFPESEEILREALHYSRDYSPKVQKQALLAYLFTAGRKVVDGHVREAVKGKDVILDRWQVTGWAYQVDPVRYTWQDIKRLNEDFGIVMPNVQIILTCSIDQIPLRKSYRDKEGAGTAGQMSMGREHIILPAFIEIFDALQGVMSVAMIENAGTPTPDLTEQIKQAIQTYGKVEELLRISGFALQHNPIGNPEAFWLEPQRLQRIIGRQVR